MSTSTAAELDQLQTDLSSGGVEAVLQRLADQLRDKKQYHELTTRLSADPEPTDWRVPSASTWSRATLL